MRLFTPFILLASAFLSPMSLASSEPASTQSEISEEVKSLDMQLLETIRPKIECRCHPAPKPNLNKVKELIEAGASVNAHFPNGLSVLSAAAFDGNKELCELLLSSGADIEGQPLPESFGASHTPLIAAAINGHKEVAELLILFGANVNAQVKDGQTALLLASYYGHLEFVNILLAAGSDVNVRLPVNEEYNVSGETALTTALIERHSEVAKSLILAGADLNVQSTYGWTPLMRAARNGDIEIVKLLLEKGADKSLKMHYSTLTAADWAELSRNPEVIALLPKEKEKKSW